MNYYLLAQDVWRLSTLCWYAQTSMLKTLAAKHKSSVAKMAARYKAKVITGHGPSTCFEARRHREGKKDLVARFGGIPLRQDRRAVIHYPAPARIGYPRKELIHRLRKRRCELCEHGATVAVHQVAALRHLGRTGPGQPAWAALMAKMRRKTLIVCAACHEYIHANPSRTRHKSLESPVHRKDARRVRREALSLPRVHAGRTRDLAVQPTLRVTAGVVWAVRPAAMSISFLPGLDSGSGMIVAHPGGTGSGGPSSR